MPRPPAQKELTEDIISDFDRLGEEILGLEESIKSNISLPAQEPLDKSEINLSLFIPTFNPGSSQGLKRDRELSLVALILALRDRLEGNRNCYKFLDPKDGSKSIEAEKSQLRSEILTIYDKFLSIEEETDFDLITSSNEAYYVRPNEYDLDEPEIVLVTVPREGANPGREIMSYIQHLVKERVGFRGGGTLDATLSHELTHYVIENSFSGNMIEEERNSPSLIALNEGAAYAITYVYLGSFDAGDSYHREKENVNINELETAAQTFLEMTKGLETRKRIEKIREIAIKAIEECHTEGDLEVLDEFVSGEIRENYQKIKVFNSSRQEIMQRFSESLYLLGFVSEEELPNKVQVSRKGIIQSDLSEMIDIAEDIISHNQNKAIRETFDDLKELMSVYGGSKEEIHQDFLKLEEKDLDSIKDVRNDHFGRFVVTERDIERINQDLNLYEQFVEVTLDSLSQIREVLSRIHEEEKIETSNVDSKRFRKLLELTEESLEQVNNCIQDLGEAEKEINHVRSEIN